MKWPHCFQCFNGNCWWKNDDANSHCCWNQTLTTMAQKFILIIAVFKIIEIDKISIWCVCVFSVYFPYTFRILPVHFPDKIVFCVLCFLCFVFCVLCFFRTYSVYFPYIICTFSGYNCVLCFVFYRIEIYQFQ